MQHAPIEPRYIMVQQPGQRHFDPTRPHPLEPRPLELKPADVKPTAGPKSAEPKGESKSGPSIARPFPCTFAQYNCAAAFTSKNEWKRHISTKHIQLGFWRCDMCPPSPGIDLPVYNDFNRKDLFTQHLRRMHGGVSPPTPGKDPQTPGSEQPQSAPQPSLTEDQIQEIQKRCYKQLRSPPQISNCVFCTRIFQGPNSWEERLEHVGGHLERDRKNGANTVDISTWREDPPLREYLLTEGIVEMDPVRGGWRIGDGKPRRDMSMNILPQIPISPVYPGMPTGGPPPGASKASAINIDTESEGSSGRRKRGRPTKRFSLNDPPQEDEAGHGEDQEMTDAPPPPPQPPGPQQPMALSPRAAQAPTPFQSQIPMQAPMQYLTPLQPREGPLPSLVRRESGGYLPPQMPVGPPPGIPLQPHEQVMAMPDPQAQAYSQPPPPHPMYLPHTHPQMPPQPQQMPPQQQQMSPHGHMALATVMHSPQQPQHQILRQASPPGSGPADDGRKNKGKTFREVILS